MRIINIMQDVRAVNNGIREAATNTSAILLSKYNIQTELWFFGNDHQKFFYAATPVSLEQRTITYLKKKIEERKLSPQNDIIVTHGSWNFQSFWGNHLSKKNYKWLFVPHGTIQPCSMAQKWLKKKIYFSSVEKKMLDTASVIRAISSPEENHLKKLFPKKEIVCIPNGIETSQHNSVDVREAKKNFLFMARLHPQKGIVPLVNAWIKSSLNNNAEFFLAIAGPDEGELVKINSLWQQSNNIKYLGVIYNDEKINWISKSTFFILPSRCEGFPVSLLETASTGLIPVISENCNFPELFDQHLAIKTSIDEKDIFSALETCKKISQQNLHDLSANVSSYIRNNYNLDSIAQKQYDLYSKLLTQ